MMTQKLRACFRVSLLLVFSAVNFGGFAQEGWAKVPNVAVGSNCNGYMRYLPSGYNQAANSTKRYPLMIYFTGIGNTGTGSISELDKLYTGANTPQDQGSNWPDAFTVNSVSYQYLVMTPQFYQSMGDHIPTPDEVNEIINYTISTFRIDTSRIYLIGASQGAGAIWDYIGSNSANARRIAAAVPFAGVSFPFQTKANTMKYNKVAVWALHNSMDNLVPSSFTNEYIDFYNQPPNIGIPAKKTLFNSGGHLCWAIPLTGSYREGGLNVYEWMLQYKTDPSKAFAGEDQEISAPTSSVQLGATGTAANGTTSSYQWSKLYGPTGAVTFSNPNIANPTVSNLAQGTYVFQVNILGTAGSVATDYVAVTVNPPKQRIEAETYTNTNAPVSPATDAQGVLRVDNINNDDVLNYTVSIPYAGLYRIRFHVGSAYGGCGIQVRNAANVTLGSVGIYGLGFENRYLDRFMDVFLDAGTQTLKIASNSTPTTNAWYMDWFEIIQPSQAQYPLPVAFSLFNANCKNNAIELLWKTSGESGTKSFVIEKSSDGRVWNQLATLAPSTDPANNSTYKYSDNSGGSTSLYRVVEESYDGKKTYTSVIKGSCSEKSIFSVYPNPVTDKGLLSVSLARETKLDLSITDSKGSTIRKQSILAPQGNNQFSLDFSTLPSGIYTVTAVWDGEVRSVRVVKKG